jgi:hypothetical protein
MVTASVLLLAQVTVLLALASVPSAAYVSSRPAAFVEGMVTIVDEEGVALASVIALLLATATLLTAFDAAVTGGIRAIVNADTVVMAWMCCPFG